MCERVCKVTLSPWQMRTTRPDPNAKWVQRNVRTRQVDRARNVNPECRWDSERVRKGHGKGSRKNPIGRTAKRSNHKQPSTDDRRATRARDGAQTHAHTHRPRSVETGRRPGRIGYFSLLPLSPLASFAYEHSLEQPRRVGVARRCQRVC